MTRRLSVLILDDSPGDAELLLLELREGGYEPNALVVCTPDALRAALFEIDWELVISDWSMPRFNGLEAFRITRECGFDMPFIIVSGAIEEEIAAEALRSGVHDFVTKARPARLLPAIARELREHAEHRLRREAEAEVEVKRREIAESESLLRLVLDSVPDAVAVVDREGEFVLWNRAADPIVALRTLADPGSGRYGFFLPDQATPQPLAEVLLGRTVRGEELDRRELWFRAPQARDGMFLSVATRILRDADGAVRGAVGLFRDLTQEKASHEQLMTSDRMASIGMLAAGVAHEINNPLAAVLANLELAQTRARLVDDGGGRDARQALAALITDARHAADAVRRIVRDLKVFARHEEPDGEPVDVHEVLESSIRMAWNEIRHRAMLVRSFRADRRVLATPSRLGQVFLNLLVNAAQAIPEGRADANEIRVATRCDAAGRVVVEVTDSGSGISPESLNRMFSPFYTTKSDGDGTGLGLAICRRIVTDYGGELGVESRPGHGATFRVVLPAAAPATSRASSAAPAPATTPARGGTVLVVDDEPMIGLAIRRLLHPSHEVATCLGADEALARFDRGERYDLVLCDLMMPHMTGMAFHEALSRRDSAQAARIVFMTGGAFTPAAREFLAASRHACIDKPFDPDELRAFVASRMETHAAADPRTPV